MSVRTVGLTAYKNLSTIVELDPGLNLLVADNGTGKSNFLEAIYYFYKGSSFRGVADTEIFPYEQDVDYSASEIVLASEERLKLVWTKTGEKRYYRNGKTTNVATTRRLLPTLLYAPTSMDVVTDGARLRRELLDGALCQLRLGYRQVLANYKRTLLQKQRLLQFEGMSQATKLAQLRIWNAKQAELAGQVTSERLKLLQSLLPILQETAAMIYQIDDFTPGAALQSNYLELSALTLHDELETPDAVVVGEALQAKLKAGEDKELAAQAVLYGPQRDDFNFLLGKRNVRTAASRGQQRLYGLILHLALLAHYESDLGKPFLLLFDDIFSELDKKHAAATYEYIQDQLIKGEGHQAIITAPDKHFLPKKLQANLKLSRLLLV